MLALPREADDMSGCVRRSDASGRGLHETGLCAAHRDRNESERLNRSGRRRTARFRKITLAGSATQVIGWLSKKAWCRS